jgi:DNA ligase (NAD+)
MVAKKVIASFADLFTLDQPTVEGLERMGSKSARNLIDSIASSRQISLHRFLYALGIGHVGEHVARILAERFTGLEDLSKATREELEAIPEVGPIVAASVVNFFNRAENQSLLRQLLQNGVVIGHAPPARRMPLAGRSFVLTGALSGMTRRQAQELIAAAGGQVSGTVNRNTDYLVAGNAPGSKLQRARELGVAVIDEAELRRLIG